MVGVPVSIPGARTRQRRQYFLPRMHSSNGEWFLRPDRSKRIKLFFAMQSNILIVTDLFIFLDFKIATVKFVVDSRFDGFNSNGSAPSFNNVINNLAKCLALNNDNLFTLQRCRMDSFRNFSFFFFLRLMSIAKLYCKL